MFRTATALLVLVLSPLVGAQDWPQEVTAREGTIVVYQPQPEKLSGNVLTGRAAVSLELNDHEEPIFGAMWFEARIDTDRAAGTAIVRDLKVTKVGWPDSRDADEVRFTQVIEGAVPSTGFEISLDRLSASLETAELEQKSLSDLKTDPPEILFEDKLAVLLLYDGQPRFSPVDDSSYERALNTPFVVVRDTRSQAVYLSSGQYWYRASDPLGPFAPTDEPPVDLVRMLPAPEADDAASGGPPAVVVATSATELIVTDGKPDWQSLPGGELLYVTNTETAWVRELTSGQMYVLLSGRWYRSGEQSGPWTFVRADELPQSFQDIPPASDIGGLRVSVAGTEEADQAMLDAAIPQTTAIRKSEASLTVEYDGKPKFEKIPNTSVAYAVNTGAQVLEIKGAYYAVDNGVWFTAAAATGPWQVADSVPQDEIDKIPPSSPAYNTTYVHIYESTPEVVYVGYTPGYLWSFPYYGVPVYGTGWYYPPYWGSWYYPRPPTWGFHVGYNPWTGWNVGMSWSNGFFSFGVSWGGGWGGAYRPWGCCGGWYGGGYRRPVVINTGDINIGNSVSIGNRTTVKNRIGDNTVNANRSQRENLYNRPENRRRNADPAVARSELKRARPAPQRANNVYADRNGQVARRTDNGWESRGDGSWQAARENTSAQARDTRIDRESISRDSVSAAGRTAMDRSGFDRGGLNQAHHARQMGGMREAGRLGGGRLRR